MKISVAALLALAVAGTAAPLHDTRDCECIL